MRENEWMMIAIGIGFLWMMNKKTGTQDGDLIPYGIDYNGETYYYNSKTNAYEDKVGKPVNKDGDPISTSQGTGTNLMPEEPPQTPAISASDFQTCVATVGPYSVQEMAADSSLNNAPRTFRWPNNLKTDWGEVGACPSATPPTAIRVDSEGNPWYIDSIGNPVLMTW